MNIAIPRAQEVIYMPGVLETIKFAWIQYIMVLIPVLMVFNMILGFLFRYRIFDATLVSDLRQKRQIF